MDRIQVRFLSAAVAIAALLSSCGGGKQAVEEEQKVVTPVTVTVPGKGTISDVVEIPATSTFLSKSIIRALTTGTIENVKVKYGDNVRNGDLLFIMRTREASVLRSAQAPDSSMSVTGEIRVFSSANGVITGVAHHQGDFVQEGDELATISDRNSFVFIMDLPFEMKYLAEQGKGCSLVLSDGKIYAGTIGGQLPEMDQESQTIKYFIRATVPGDLPANLNIKVRLVRRESRDATILPREAVIGNETQTEFWVMKLMNDSVAVKVPVTKGIEEASEIEITGPKFDKTDRIILKGAYGLPDTADIVIKD
ncbi:MAG: HlyD family efflux transporter periplasmic adaptor subunit [Bacteroidales bacterium]